MNVLLIYAHPSTKSFTYQVLQQLIKGLEASNHKIEISDLYDMGFVSDMSEMEYEREGLIQLELPITEDVKKEHEKIEKSDCILFVYPVWWSDCPAKLKGWFDRVYSVGYAYGKTAMSKMNHQMPLIKLGLCICTAGHSNTFLKEIGIAESMRNVMIDDRLGNRFEKKEMIILGGTTEIEKVREKHLMMAFSIGEDLEKYLD